MKTEENCIIVYLLFGEIIPCRIVFLLLILLLLIFDKQHILYFNDNF